MRTYLMSLRNSIGGPVWLELSWDQMGSGAWDRLLQPCNACTWTHLSWSKQQNMKKLCGAKNNCMHAQLGQIMNKKIQKRPKKPQMATSEDLGEKKVSGAKAGYCECPLHLTPQRGGQTTYQPLDNPLATPLSSPHMRNQLPPSLPEENKNLFLVFAPSFGHRSPSEGLPELFVWPLVNFYWLGKAKNSGWYQSDQWFKNGKPKV